MEWIWFIVVALIWGFTNPFLKRGSKDISRIETSNKLLKIWQQLKWLATNLPFVVPFLINQSGSILYYVTVARSDISLAVPVINSLTLLITTIIGILIGEKIQSPKCYLGMCMVVGGVATCLL